MYMVKFFDTPLTARLDGWDLRFQLSVSDVPDVSLVACPGFKLRQTVLQ